MYFLLTILYHSSTSSANLIIKHKRFTLREIISTLAKVKDTKNTFDL